MARKVTKLSFVEAKAKSTSWAITFGDMVTLLLTFFILLLVIMNEAEKHIDRIINLLLKETYQELHHELRFQSWVTVEHATKGVKIKMASAGGDLFKSGEETLRPEFHNIIRQVGYIIKMSPLVKVHDIPKYKPFLDAIRNGDKELNIEIRCEGHTDNVPLPDRLQVKYKDNWELSTARALNVVKLLSEYAGIEQEKFSAMGYGEFRPEDSNDTPDGRANNRRVEIYLDAFLTDIKISDKKSLEPSIN